MAGFAERLLSLAAKAMNVSRRTFLEGAGLATLASTAGCFTPKHKSTSVLVNDVHTQLNPTFVRCVTPATSLKKLQKIIRLARRDHRPISIAGGRHAAGGQQFAAGIELVDTRPLRRVLIFDFRNGTIEVETGIQWPELMTFLREARAEHTQAWTVSQKQTGTDRLSIGGALAANAHGRGLTLPPIISNVESMVLVDAKGALYNCSRNENPELFKLAIGGYGLFGFIYSAKLRLTPLRRVRRIVRLLEVLELPATFAEKVHDGFLYGDFQFAIDPKSNDFLNRGIFACYEPIAESTPLSSDRRKLSAEDWEGLIHLAHTNPTLAFDRYSQHYLATSGQVYDSDQHYVSDYFEQYHQKLDLKLTAAAPGTEVIGELNVPRDALPRFLGQAREVLRRTEAAPLIYGTIRLIEKDKESFLCWAKQSYACVIFNLHTPHTQEGLGRTRNTFRKLIDRALHHDGSFYLTYHRYATRAQVLACYPQFPEFMRLKLHYDPEEQFQSDWYRHFKQMFA